MQSRKPILIAVAVVVVCLGVAIWHFAGGSDPTDKLGSTDPLERQEAVAAMAASADTDAGLERIAKAVKSENAVVACSALQALAVSTGPDKPLPEQSVKVVESATRDTRPVVQVTALQTLEATTPELPEDKTVPTIVLKTFVDANTPEVRAAAANALGKFQYWEAMESLINAMEDDSPEVRGSAGTAVRKILGLDYGFRANAPLAQREAVVARLRQEWRAQLPFHQDYARRVHQARKAEQ